MTCSRLIAGFFAAFLAVEAGPVPAAGLPGINGTDDRVLIDSADSPWNAIGRLNREGGGFCTGVAIGRRTVLTAAHCLWNRRTLRWGGAQTIHFLGGYRRGAWLDHARVASYKVGDTRRNGARAPNPDPAGDWAVLTLARDLDPKVVPLPLVSFDGGGEDKNASYVQGGYSRDKPHMLTVDRNCHVSGAGGLLTHDCDATQGDSGAPLLVRRDDGGYDVIGVHIGNIRGGTVGIAISSAEILSRQNGVGPR